jgi:hypothetical protein
VAGDENAVKQLKAAWSYYKYRFFNTVPAGNPMPVILPEGDFPRLKIRSNLQSQSFIAFLTGRLYIHGNFLQGKRFCRVLEKFIKRLFLIQFHHY